MRNICILAAVIAIAPPAALYYASRDRKHEHPVQHLQAFAGILQADAYSEYNELYDPSRSQASATKRIARFGFVALARTALKSEAETRRLSILGRDHPGPLHEI
jgi:hypothetical protein